MRARALVQTNEIDLIADAIIERLLPRLTDLWSSQRGGAKSPSQETLFAVQLQAGKRLLTSISSAGGAQRLQDEIKPDLVLDEIEGLFSVHAAESKQHAIADLPRSARGMLWLVLNAGSSALIQDDVIERFGLSRAGGNRAVAQRVYQYISALRQLVGPDLADRMLSRGSRGSYLLKRSGWTFLWVRRHEDPSLSDLLYDIEEVQ